MNRTLANSYACAEQIARSRARNFYYSFVVLPPEKKRALCAVYAFMRFCDDISDGEGGIESKRQGLAAWRAQLEAAARGECDGSPILPAFHDSMQRFSIPADYFHWIIDGAEMDLTVDTYPTFEDLYRYCFRVASAVGLVCLQIFEYSEPHARALAEHCGIAFQLTNILRDLKEDASMGRIYLPVEDLEKFGYQAEELRDGIVNDRFRRLMAFEAERASGYYASGHDLIPLVDKNSRPALWAMIEIYERLLKRIVARNYDVFEQRIRLSSAEKGSIALRALSKRYLKI
jgi:phytoene synthase